MTVSPERIEEALALLERYGEGALGAKQAAETVRAALREAQAENERLRDAGAKALEYANAHGLTDATYWVRDLRAALAMSLSTERARKRVRDEAKP